MAAQAKVTRATKATKETRVMRIQKPPNGGFCITNIFQSFFNFCFSFYVWAKP